MIPGGARRLSAVGLSALALATLLAVQGMPRALPASGASNDEATIATGAPSTLDPARVGDAASAAVTAQLFEGLTAFDPDLAVRPALARSWEILDGGRRIVFHLRPGLSFSDGSPLTAADVVRSWLRLIDPANPSPLASLMLPVEGAAAYLRGEVRDSAQVGLRAIGADVEARFSHPSADFVSVVASPSFGVVSKAADSGGDAFLAGELVSSGGYVLTAEEPTGLTLTANERYWAGRPAIGTIRLVTDLGGRSEIDAFERDELDYTPISPYDASWIAYDADLGPQLREVPSLSVDYYGFDTSRPPFDDPRVRRAFAQAVDWRRIVRLSAGDSATPATSMVPIGIPGRGETDFGPRHDPAAARAELAAAGYPDGAGFPPVTLVSTGYGYDGAIVREIEDVLGVTVAYETMPFDQYFTRLATEPPAFWSLSWVADYPGPNDFLGLLLGSGQSNNYGRWSSAEFDAAIGDANAATDPAVVRAAFDRAESVVQRDAPVIPVSYGTGWALSRTGLLGARQNGLGILRLAGLAWGNR